MISCNGRADRGTFSVMLKTMWRFASDVCWRLGFERLSLRFLLWSLETVNVDVTLIPAHNIQAMVKRPMPEAIDVVYVDRDLITELGERYRNDVSVATSAYDVN